MRKERSEIAQHRYENARKSAGLTVGFALLGIVSGLPLIADPSPFGPTLVIAALACAGVVWACLSRPTRALYATLFMTLLPVGLLPPELHSLLNRGLMLLTCLIWIGCVLRQKCKVVFTPSLLLMLLFLGWSLITLIWANDLSRAAVIFLMYMTRGILFLLLVPSLITTRQDLDKLMKLLFCIGFCVAISSLLFLLVYGYSSGTRLKVFEVNENEIGVALLIFFPGVLWLSCKDRVRFFSPSNLLAFFYLMTAILITVLSGSRGSVLSFGITILAFVLWNTTRKWAKICVWVLLLSLLFAPFLFKTSFERFGELSSPKPLGPREDLWASAIDLIGDHPVGGVGIGNSIFSIGPYLTRFGYGSDADGTPIHNPILVVWSETGIVGAGLYVGVLIAALLSFSRCIIATWPSEMLWLRGYCHIVFSVFVGYIASWIKGGSMETGASYFFIISLMLIPAVIARGLAQQEEP